MGDVAAGCLTDEGNATVVQLMLDPVEAQILAGLDELNGAFDEFDPDDAYIKGFSSP